ncbi:20075_t:CDS:2 [Gigaspora margarita]|uniref:20075_t:CDS:1 n=1 Tax=Gigaspora margarita TaxID=4874 RepID=A0ABN7VW86_GIGMA|nr:20075_t:CDS:2 [Gigaspora margarita]
MNAEKHPIFDSIFAETHRELESLNSELIQLRSSYQTTHDSDEDEDENTQMFHLYLSFPMQNLMEYQSIHTKKLEEQDNDAFVKKLEKKCCTKLCLNKVDLQLALNRFKEIKAMSISESNFFFLGIIHANIRKPELVDGTPKSRMTTKYSFEGTEICQEAWFLIHGIGTTRWKSLREHYQKNGLVQKFHNLTGRNSNDAISFVIVLFVLKFIINFAKIHGLPSPGRSFRDDTKNIIFLPSCESKRSLYRLYNNATNEEDKQISLSSFLRIWKRYLPNIKFMTPRSDLCMVCKSARFGAKYWSMNEVEQKIQEWTNHFNWAGLERENYRIIFYDWAKFLDKFYTSIPSLLVQHHFVISSKNQGKVETRARIDGNITQVSIARVSMISRAENGALILPEVITAPGITLEREWYLYDQVAQHIQNPLKRDSYCAKPAVPKPKRSRN